MDLHRFESDGIYPRRKDLISMKGLDLSETAAARNPHTSVADWPNSPTVAGLLSTHKVDWETVREPNEHQPVAASEPFSVPKAVGIQNIE